MTDAIWRINVADQSETTESVPASWQRLGGRGLIPRILLDEVAPDCDPLGLFNKLLFSPGLLVGHMLSSCDRLSVGGKSPLTGGVKESKLALITPRFQVPMQPIVLSNNFHLMSKRLAPC